MHLSLHGGLNGLGNFNVHVFSVHILSEQLLQRLILSQQLLLDLYVLSHGALQECSLQVLLVGGQFGTVLSQTNLNTYSFRKRIVQLKSYYLRHIEYRNETLLCGTEQGHHQGSRAD